MATREEIEQIRAKADILDIISHYVTVRPSGKNFMAICPFHPDKAPSLTISQEKGLFHCFGCGEGGDVFKFLMSIERLDFPEAVRRLAAQVGVTIKDDRGASDGPAKLRELAEKIACHYEKKLKEPIGRRAREYLRERGLAPETMARFRLGYAPPAGDDLLKAFTGLDSELIRLGLVLEGDSRKRVVTSAAIHQQRRASEGRWSFFRHRVIFPICSLQGAVVGFAGRTLTDEEPKYLNTRNTPLFEKSRLLYGLPWARAALAERGEALLVEGYMDVLMAHQQGFTHAVASMGTAFTAEQARLLKRFVSRVFLAYDRDVAGRWATLRGIKQLLSAGLEVSIVLLPKGEDPDGLLRREGREAFEALLQRAMPFPEFYVQALLEEHDARRFPGQEQILSSTREFLEGLESPALRAQIIRELAGALRIPDEDLHLRMKGKRPVTIMGQDAPAEWGVETHLMCLLLQGKLPIKRVMHELSPVDFPRFSHAVENLLTLYREQGGPERLEGPAGRQFLNEWLAGLDPEDQRELRGLAIGEHRDADSETAITQLIVGLRLMNVERRLKILKQEIGEAEQRHDRSALERLQQEHQQRGRERLELLRQLGWKAIALQGGGRRDGDR